jgi:hypothetical protein
MMNQTELIEPEDGKEERANGTRKVEDDPEIANHIS